MATAAVNNGGWEVQGAALLRLRQSLECVGLQLWLEGAMVQAGMTAAMTRARSCRAMTLAVAVAVTRWQRQVAVVARVTQGFAMGGRM